MSRSTATTDVTKTLDQVKTKLLQLLQDGDTDGRVATALGHIERVVNRVGELTPCPKRNDVNKEEFEAHKKSDSVIVRTFEVGTCSMCDAVGAVGHNCNRACCGHFRSHIDDSVIPSNIVRFYNPFFDADQMDEEPLEVSIPTSKKRKKWSPETLEELTRTAMFANVTEWSGNQEDYVESCVNELFEMAEDETFIDDEKLVETLHAHCTKAHEEWSKIVERKFDEYKHKYMSIDASRIQHLLTHSMRKKKKKKRKR